MRKAPKRIRRRPDPGPYAPGVDFHAAERVADLVAVIRVDGEPTPLATLSTMEWGRETSVCR